MKNTLKSWMMSWISCIVRYNIHIGQNFWYALAYIYYTYIHTNVIVCSLFIQVNFLPNRHSIQISRPPMKISCCHRNAHRHRPFVYQKIFLEFCSEERYFVFFFVASKSCLDVFVIINKLIQHYDMEQLLFCRGLVDVLTVGAFEVTLL